MGKVRYVSELIEKYRIEHEYSNTDVAYLLGIAPYRLGAFLHGGQSWPWYVIQRIYHRLGIPAKDLLDASPEHYNAATGKRFYNKIAPKGVPISE